MTLVTLRNDFGSAVVSSHAGATLRSLRPRIDGHEYELLSGGMDEKLDQEATPSGVGSFIMAPWVNRITHGLLETEHGDFKLPVSSGIHAMHGTVRGSEWDIASSDESSAIFEIALSAPWPFAGKITYEIALLDASLVQTLTVSAATGERAFPAGVGWHPWFRRSLGSEELELQIDAAAQWEIDSEMVPSGKLDDTPAARRLRNGDRFAMGELDDCFLLGSERTSVLRWPELSLRMKSSGTVTNTMVYTPEDSVCVEPQTSTVNAFQLERRGIANTGTRIVNPEQPLVAETAWSWS